ncbi:MAG: SDR family oxidoreductase [Aeromicrobium sp.]|uniref:SDR family NAD(P)-dependent oxidoreductase n=1 Tax=Aeromicrobium sp. TaxID=1871063 RepID=UPI003C64B992
MEVTGASAVVTGAAGGIGAALGQRLLERGAGLVVLSDLDATRLSATAEAMAAEHGVDRVAHLAADVTSETAIEQLADLAGGVPDIFIANAGIFSGFGLESTDAEWAASLDVNLMSHVRAARVLVPRWLDENGGCFAVTASAAGLLTQLGSPTYATSKRAAVGFAEWLAATYGDRGVQVAALCPMGVRTPMTENGDVAEGDAGVAHGAVSSAGDMMDPLDVADVLLDAIEGGQFLALPHAQVGEMYAQKAADPDRWTSGMQRFRRSLER